MNFSKTLKTLRKEKHLTQGQLASYLNTSRSTIAGYETKSRQPDFEMLQRLADYFEVSIDFLITGENSITSPKAAYSHINEISLELEMKSIYRQLTAMSKYDVLKYAKLLHLQETYTQHSKRQWHKKIGPSFKKTKAAIYDDLLDMDYFLHEFDDEFDDEIGAEGFYIF